MKNKKNLLKYVYNRCKEKPFCDKCSDFNFHIILAFDHFGIEHSVFDKIV